MNEFIFIIILITLPLLLLGIINKTKAFMAGKQGAPIIQLYYDFFKLLRKSQVISRTTSIIFKYAPAISLSCLTFSALLMPIMGSKSILNFQGNFILFCYILGLNRFFMILGALDTGSGFEGMGANREITFSVVAEPAMFMLLGSLAFLNKDIATFHNLFITISNSGVFTILSVIILFIILLTETSRVPVDDPKTHLELTMIHEVMVLDYSGIDLALIHFSSGLKMLIFNSLIISLIINSLSITKFIFIHYIILQIVLSVVIGLLESCVSRFRMSHIPQFVFLSISIASILCVLILIL
jgi:formate hydrogenlyase subunit 4